MAYQKLTTSVSINIVDQHNALNEMLLRIRNLEANGNLTSASIITDINALEQSDIKAKQERIDKAVAAKTGKR